MKRLIEEIKNNAPMTEAEILQHEIARFIGSEQRSLMITGRKYYAGEHEIKYKRREGLDANGESVELKRLPNNKITNNLFDDLVDVKTNFLLGNPCEIVTDSEEVKAIFNNSFLDKLNTLGKECLLCGVAYVIPYIKDNLLKFKLVKAEQVVPFWSDEEKENMDAFAYFYDIEEWSGKTYKTVRHVEFYDKSGVKYYVEQDGKLVINREREPQPHININGLGYNFNKPPIVAFKANTEMQPLIVKVKNLQDAYNTIWSNFVDSVQEDMRNTVLVIKNHDGTDLSEFRHNLNVYGAIKVTSIDGEGGGVDTLNIDVNAENYKVILKLLEESIIKNGRGFDGKDDRMKNAPNQMNIQSMYSDMLLDARTMERKFLTALDELKYFASIFFKLKRKELKDVSFIFNKDLPINTSELVQNCRDSVGVISHDTILKNHPFVTSSQEEGEKIRQEKEKEINAFSIPLQGGALNE